MNATTVETLETLRKKARDAAEPSQLSDEERLQRAKDAFLANLDSEMATHLESCIHCGMCAEACHYQTGTQDPRYTPIHKVEPLKRFYRREVDPLRWLRRLWTPKLTLEDLEAWKPLVYDGCSQCGRCSILCPMGIHIQQLIYVTRTGMAAAGLAPEELQGPTDEQLRDNTLFGAGSEQLKEKVEELRSKGYDIPLDKDKADVLVLSTSHDLIGDSGTLEATVKVLNHTGVDWTIRSDAFESSNYGFLSGDKAAKKKISERIINAAIDVGAERVIISECGHAYPTLRWEAANLHQKALPFEVQSISEFLAAELEAGRLKVTKDAGGNRTWAYHDSCKMGRLGGAIEEPRAVLRAMGVEIKEMESHGRTNLCCGGGGGVIMMPSAQELRRKAFTLKREDVDNTGATDVAVSCGGCRTTLETGKAETNWNINIHSLVEMVADRLAS